MYGYRKGTHTLKKQYSAVFRTLAARDGEPPSAPLLHFLLRRDAGPRALAGSGLKDWAGPHTAVPPRSTLLPTTGTPRKGTLPSDMLDSWNIVSKAWWISAKEGRSEGFHCQPEDETQVRLPTRPC